MCGGWFLPSVGPSFRSFLPLNRIGTRAPRDGEESMAFTHPIDQNQDEQIKVPSSLLAPRCYKVTYFSTSGLDFPWAGGGGSLIWMRGGRACRFVDK